MKYKLPKRAEKTYLELVRIKIYNDPLFHSSIPEEAAISYPIPVPNTTESLIYFFHYWVKSYPSPHIVQLSRILTKVQPDNLKAIKILTSELPGSSVYPQIIVPEITAVKFPPQLSQEEKRLKEVQLYLSCQAIMSGGDSFDSWQLYSSALAQLSISNLLPVYHLLNSQVAI